MIAREIIIRRQLVVAGAWRVFFILSVCLGFSACYEIMEWSVAIVSGESAEAFLGLQGYAWDTQSDMAFALLGAITAMTFLARLHDQQLESLGSKGNE